MLSLSRLAGEIKVQLNKLRGLGVNDNSWYESFDEGLMQDNTS